MVSQVLAELYYNKINLLHIREDLIFYEDKTLDLRGF